MNWAVSKMKIEKLGIHASETAWVGTNFAAVMDNNTTIDDLFAQVKSLVEAHPTSTLPLPSEELADSLHTLS